MKTVYHGTTLDRANKIIESGLIEKTNNKNRRYKNTRIGYVYLTSVLQNALEFSVRPTITEDYSSFAVFRFKISEHELVIDKDEQKWNSFLFRNDGPCCYTISRDIDIIKEHVEWYTQKCDYDSSYGDFVDYINDIAKNIKESEWNKWRD